MSTTSITVRLAGMTTSVLLLVLASPPLASAQSFVEKTTRRAERLDLGFNDGAVRGERSGYDSWGGDNHGSFQARVVVQRSAAAPSSVPRSQPGTPSDATVVNSIGMEFVRIPAGEFLMGSSADEDARDSDEGPQHRVRISRPFSLGKYEVTQAQWEVVMGSTSSSHTGCATCPVANVSWVDVQAYLRKLNALAGRPLYRLPTEAEWEYAARAGTSTAYSFGDNRSQLGRYAWYDDNSGGTTHPVGQKQPNPWGLYDMHGNVWEWVQDWYDSGYYARSPSVDPQGHDGGYARVIRGGAWRYFASNCRSADRNHAPPDYRFDNLGFRLLRMGP